MVNMGCLTMNSLNPNYLSSLESGLNEAYALAESKDNRCERFVKAYYSAIVTLIKDYVENMRPDYMDGYPDYMVSVQKNDGWVTVQTGLKSYKLAYECACNYLHGLVAQGFVSKSVENEIKTATNDFNLGRSEELRYLPKDTLNNILRHVGIRIDGGVKSGTADYAKTVLE